jgi:hypothetical protein
MKPPKAPGKAAPHVEDLAQLAQDWITLWQSELSALAADRETAETWQALLALWAGSAAAMLRTMPRGMSASGRDNARDDPARPARSAAASRAAPAAAASDVRDAEIDRLHRIIADLERRLADVERRAGQPRADRRSSGRLPRKR